MRCELLEAAPELRADGVYRNARGDRGHLGEAPAEVLSDVRLVQHNDRAGATLPCHREIALEAAGIEIPVEAGHEKCHIHVDRNDLLRGLAAGHLA
jgi:hypothetical protein